MLIDYSALYVIVGKNMKTKKNYVATRNSYVHSEKSLTKPNILILILCYYSEY